MIGKDKSYLEWKVMTQVDLSYWVREQTPTERLGFFMSKKISRRGICYHLNYCFARLSYTRTRGTVGPSGFIVSHGRHTPRRRWSTVGPVLPSQLLFRMGGCHTYMRYKCSQRFLMNSPNVSEYCHTCETTCYPRRIWVKINLKNLREIILYIQIIFVPLCNKRQRLWLLI